jgi:Tol biopolymer transport system component
MKHSAMLGIVLAGLCSYAPWAVSAEATMQEAPRVFAPGIISCAPHEAAPAFSPDGRTVFFQRSNSSGATILVSHREHGEWSTPTIASFSGTWNDMEPAMAPDGSYLIFVSSRPASADGKSIDGFFNGKRQAGGGGNLWRVDREGDAWDTPHRLPEVINASTTIFSPSIARDGSLYFMHPDPATKRFRLYRAQWRHGHYLQPRPLSFSTGASTDVDPAVDPDERFMVFGSSRKPAADMDLFIVFRGAQGWGKPMHMGNVIKTPGSDAEQTLSPYGKTLYLSRESTLPTHFPRTRKQAEKDIAAVSVWNNGQYNIWSIDLAAWMQHHGHPDG